MIYNQRLIQKIDSTLSNVNVCVCMEFNLHMFALQLFVGSSCTNFLLLVSYVKKMKQILT